MRRRGVPSPDEGDAVAPCFTEPGAVVRTSVKNFGRDLSREYTGLYV